MQNEIVVRIKLDDAARMVAKLRNRRDRWRKRAEDAEAAIAALPELSAAMRADVKAIKCGWSGGAAASSGGGAASQGTGGGGGVGLGSVMLSRDEWRRMCAQFADIQRDREEARAQLADRTRERDEITALHNQTQEHREQADAEVRRKALTEAADMLAKNAELFGSRMCGWSANRVREMIDKPADAAPETSAETVRRETLREVGAMLDRMASAEFGRLIPSEHRGIAENALRQAAGKVWAMVENATPR